MSKAFSDLLVPRRLTEVVDIGASPIDGDPPYKPMLTAGLCRVTGFEPRKPLNQLLEADMVYVRDFSRPQLMSDEQLKHLALIAYCCYGSVDLALRCVMLLEQRQALTAGAQRRYLELVSRSPGSTP